MGFRLVASFLVSVSVRNSVLSLPALALQPIIERGKHSWPFASSLVVSFWVGEECLKNPCLCAFGRALGQSIQFFIHYVSWGNWTIWATSSWKLLEVSRRSRDTETRIVTHRCGRRHAAIHSVVSPWCEGKPCVETQGGEALGTVIEKRRSRVSSSCGSHCTRKW